MTPEQIQIAIAQACGWRQTRVIDLNAMHEAETILNADQMVSYDYQLDRVVGNGRQGLNIEYFLWSATASQRAEAFLCAICK